LKLSTILDRVDLTQKIKITHPFHPLSGQEFELVDYRHNWGENRVYFYDKTEHLFSIPADWTDIVLPDPFVEISEGRSFFRLEDLFRLCQIIENIAGGGD
jgi:hypothetical protein